MRQPRHKVTMGVIPIFFFLLVLTTSVTAANINRPLYNKYNQILNYNDFTVNNITNNLTTINNNYGNYSGTPSHIIYTNAVGQLADEDNLFYNYTTHAIIINQNSAPASTSLTGTVFSGRGADGGNVRLATSSYSGNGSYANRAARGTAAAPAVVQRGDDLFAVEGWGYAGTAGTGYSNEVVSVRGYAGNTFNATSQPTYISFWLTDFNSITPRETMRIENGFVNITNNLMVTGNLSVKRPYAMYSSTQTQTCAAANTAYPMTFNWTEDYYEIIKSNDNSNFSFQQSGDYEILLSIMAQSTSPGQRAYIWIQKNGVNVPRSTTVYDFKSTNSLAVIAVPFILDMNTTDIFRVMYAGDSTGINFPVVAATSFAPITPSAIITIAKLSEITT